MANHLFIGLGGTGGKVLRELRKRVYEEFRSNDPDNGVFVDYVYVDSSNVDLENRTDWNVLGNSVHLGNAQKVNINGIGAGVLGNLNAFPGLKGFLKPGDVHTMQTTMASFITTGIGGQRRRLGRMLLANNMSDQKNPASFEQIVRSAVGRLQKASGDDNVDFHICAGLAGGTGSGSIIDAISQIRTWFPYQEDTHAYKIRLFLYTPERTLVEQAHDSGFYQANGYSALLELNALSLRKYNPTDITGNVNHVTGEIRRLLEEKEAFESAYIYTNVNEKGKVLDLGHGLPAAVANFIFQTTIASAQPDAQLARLVDSENNGSEPELNRSGKKVHSRKFMSFGITRVEFPETEIKEYMTYIYALSTVRQLAYNMWQEGVGYGERSYDEVGIGFADEIKDIKGRQSLMLSNNHLTLATSIVETPTSKKWRVFEESWEGRTSAVMNDILATVSKDQWLAAFSTRCKEYFDTQFRNHGVVPFFNIQRQEIKGYARAIRRHIEKKLFDEWAAGTEGGKSILEIEKYTNLLIADCGSRTTAFQQQIARMQEVQSEKSGEIAKINRAWSEIGFLGGIFGKNEKTFAAYKAAKCEYYVAATREVAYGYARELLQEVIAELTRMLEGIRKFKDEINEINKLALEQAASKCVVNEDMIDNIIEKYDPEKVRDIGRMFVCDKEKMAANAAAIRARMVDNLGEEGDHTFANLYEKTDYNTAINIILDVCETNAIRDMEDAAKNDPLNKMVGVNILEKLKDELNTDEKMEAFVTEVVNSASSYVQMDAVETAQHIDGNIGAMRSMVQLCLPEGNSESTNAFRQKLINAFQHAIPGFDVNKDVVKNYKENQIVVICVKSGFPLRFLANVKTAKEKYDALMSKHHPNQALNSIVLHTESFGDDMTDILPSLYYERPNPNTVMKNVMLAYALGIVEEQQDPVTQEKFDAISSTDPTFGSVVWTRLGRNIIETWQELSNDWDMADVVRLKVKEYMATHVRSNDQKAAVRKNLLQVLDTKILPSPMCENNKYNQNYIKFHALAVEVAQEYLTEL